MIRLIIFLIFISVSNVFAFNDYKTHRCIRECNGKPMKCEYEWHIEWYQVLSKACLSCPFNLTHCSQKDCVPANGVMRPIMVINRMLPGPSIQVCLGDEVQVRLHNHLHMSEGTSIHWHGITQRGTPFMDGVSQITQCPINAHSYFEYRYKASVRGTHLWHAHSGLQRADGAFGPIIVHEPAIENPYSSSYDYDLAEHVIVLNDWINETAIAKFSGHVHDDGNNKPTSILINGKGAARTFQDPNGTVYETPRAQFTVTPGKSYRFRIINAGVLYCPLEFSIDSHKLTVIASDGRYLQSRDVDSLFIYAGERYDFILKATQTPMTYWIRVKGFADCSVFRAFETAYLSYENGPSFGQSPLEQLNYDTMSRQGIQLNPYNTFITDLNRNQMIQIDEMRTIQDSETRAILQKIRSPKKLKKYYLAMEFNKINNPEFEDERLYSLDLLAQNNRAPLYTPQINNISMEMPSSPILYNWNKIPKNKICNHLDRKASCSNDTDFCSCIYTLEFDIGDVVEMVIIDEGFTYQTNHPMHLHGLAYAVVGIGKLKTSIKLAEVEALDKAGKLPRNFDNPPVKDTVTVPVGGYTIIRLVADNPGTWMFHCHLDFHSEIGMGLLIKIGNQRDLPRPPMNWPQCGNYDYTPDNTYSIFNNWPFWKNN